MLLPVCALGIFVGSVCPQETIRVDTDLIRVPVVVFDRDGRYIPNLKKGDFAVLEAGKLQEIDTFSTVDEPITVYLLLDTSGTMRPFMDDLGRAAGIFMSALRPSDRLFFSIFADGEVSLIKNEPIEKLLKVNKVIAIRPLASKATFVYDAVDGVLKRFASIKGRKAIILFSDALSDSRRATAADNFRDAEEQDALIYTVRYGDVTSRPEWVAARSVQKQVAESHHSILHQDRVEQIVPWWDVEAVGDGKLKRKELEAQKQRTKGYMDTLAARTGGRSFEIDKIEDLAGVFEQITLELRRTYTLSYYSNSDSGPERRKLEVKVNVPNAAVRAKREVIIAHAKPAP
ncbi:MAG: von Willebrand factor type A domain-containing protein [Acidobacteria bacterium OLB17]|nr:MAG: von Willebrand factor type A domain-containing protein [Acidobacteria bacterium OLB17]